MAKQRCCPDCFGDDFLRKQIFPSRKPRQGTCDFCGTTETQLIEPSQLRDYFEQLVNVYDENKDGKSLVDWMKNDWQLFSHDRMDRADAKALLAEILDNCEIVQRKFSPSEIYQSEALPQWDMLREEMMYTNRWFCDNAIKQDRLRELLDMLLAQSLPTQWYRARIQTEDTCFDITDMGAPDKRLSSHGRANPAGIPYLYLGSLPQTAIAEIRPYTGEEVCVAEFTIPSDINAVDLCNPRQRVSPFILAEEGDIGQLRADLPYLERLGKELERPVQPKGAAIDYVPSQYLCEFIKKQGFDGVVYRSSVSDGINLALFNPSKAVDGRVMPYKVDKVSVEATPNSRSDPV